jgi:nitrogen fixation protein NifU and related proteins
VSSDDLRALYQEVILTHSRNPDGRGIVDGWTHRAREVNPLCGDEIDLAVNVKGGVIRSLTWEGHGCAISQASASLLTGLLEGATVTDALDLVERFRTALRSRGEIELDEEHFGDAVVLGGVSRYVARVKCAMLAWVTLENALATEPLPT